MITASNRRLLPYGDRALLLECEDLTDAQAVRHWLLSQHRPEIGEIVPGARTLLLRLDADLPAELIRTMISITPPPAPVEEATAITIEVVYDGADLLEVSDQLQLTPEQLIEHHTGQDWAVAFCGFAPGFGYLAATDQTLAVPRRSSPRPRVPAGAVALADQWSAVYPTASPGGWQLIGSTERPLFDPASDPPAVLRPGMRVRFRRVEP